jgi:thiamine biosynthesis lipoprotein
MTDTPAKAPLLSRRQVLQILAVGGAAGLAWSLGFLPRAGRAAVRRSRLLLGTMVNLTVVGDDREAAEAAVTATLDRMSGLESLLSRHREESEVSRLNRTGRLATASAELVECLRLSERVSRLGDGAFDVTIQPLLDLYRRRLEEHHELPSPEEVERVRERVGHRALRLEGRTVSLDRRGMAITLDGVGKGYVVDEAVAVLEGRGFPNVLVEAGGDLLANGERRPGEPWRIGIRSPRPGLPKLQTRIDARSRAVTTSGDYMQPFTPDLTQHHILDPRTGRSSPELASATVMAPTAALADALSTLAMTLGPGRSRELLEDLPECEGYLVSKDLEVVRTSGLVVSG